MKKNQEIKGFLTFKQGLHKKKIQIVYMKENLILNTDDITEKSVKEKKCN